MTGEELSNLNKGIYSKKQRILKCKKKYIFLDTNIEMT